MTLTRLVYTSSHSTLLVNDIGDILQKSCINNYHDNITGALVVSDFGFMQLLEGEPKSVFKCFTRILSDRRHWNVDILFSGDTNKRAFPKWSMYAVQVPEMKNEVFYQNLLKGSYDFF